MQMFESMPQMGASRLYGNSRENGKVQEKKIHEIMFFHGFFHDLLAKNHPKTFRQSVRSFCTGLSLPRPLPIHFTSVLHFRFFFWKKVLLFFKNVWSISFIFIICWAPEAPGPLPDCRSHFCGSNRGIESFWNLQGTSFVTKQCPKCIANKYAKFRHQKKKQWL